MNDANTLAANDSVLSRAAEAFAHTDPWHDRDDRGLLADEVPYQFCLGLGSRGAVVLQQIHLRPAKRLIAEAVLSLIANAWYAALRGASWVFYSRDRKHYAVVHRTIPDRPAFYTLSAMTAAIEMLETAQLVEHWKTAPSPHAEYRSRFRAMPSLIQGLGRPSVADFVFDPSGPCIVLKDADGDPLPVPKSRDIRRMHRDVEAHNDFLVQFIIDVVHPDARRDDVGFMYFRELWFNPLRRRYYRVFNGNFSRGGRWYGPFWQGLPKAARDSLHIDGKPTIEIDFRACHLRLLCAMAGLELPFDDPAFDPYVVQGIERKAIKLAFNIMLNADTEAGSLGALTCKFRDLEMSPARPLARAAMGAVVASFPGFERFWNTGVGLRLQNCDAQICSRVQFGMRRAEVPVLSVHDSFIVPIAHRALLEGVMEAEMNRMCAALTSKRKSRG